MAYKKAADGITKTGKTKGKNLGDTGPTVGIEKGPKESGSKGGKTNADMKKNAAQRPRSSFSRRFSLLVGADELARLIGLPFEWIAAGAIAVHSLERVRVTGERAGLVGQGQASLTHLIVVALDGHVLCTTPPLACNGSVVHFVGRTSLRALGENLRAT